jgi:Glutaredoxin-like domain (DUF836)
VSLHLYRRENCSLCVLALAVLNDVGAAAEVYYLEDNAELEQRYGWRIPVLRRMDTGAELDWPFDAWKLRRFLDQ